MPCPVKMKKYKIVEVEWFDAQSSMSTYDLEELEKEAPTYTKSLGYLLFDKKDYIILGFMLFGDDDPLIKHHQVIPKGMIKKITTIKR